MDLDERLKQREKYIPRAIENKKLYIFLKWFKETNHNKLRNEFKKALKKGNATAEQFLILKIASILDDRDLNIIKQDCEADALWDELKKCKQDGSYDK